MVVTSNSFQPSLTKAINLVSPVAQESSGRQGHEADLEELSTSASTASPAASDCLASSVSSGDRKLDRVIEQLKAFKLRWEHVSKDPVSKDPVEQPLIDLTDDGDVVSGAMESKPVGDRKPTLEQVADQLRVRMKQPHPTSEAPMPMENQNPMENPKARDGATKNAYVLPEHATWFNICSHLCGVPKN